MTDEELATIRAHVNSPQRSADEASFLMKMDARVLLAEVERLRTENKQIAHEKMLALSEPHTWDWMEFSQENECLRKELAQARALLAGEGD